MINLKQELTDYLPIDLKNLEERGSSISDSEKNSVVLYNKALENLKSGSEDIAIIELKKAISINPNFHEAINLLGLCYSYIREYAKAAEMFERVVAAEHNSVNALRYLNEMKAGDVPAAAARKKVKPVKKASDAGESAKEANRPTGTPGMKKNMNAVIVQCAFAFLLGALVMFALLSISNRDRAVDVSKDMPAGTGEVIVKDADNSLQEKLDQSARELETVRKQLETANADTEYYKNVIKLVEVDKLVSAKKYEDAADMLVLLGTVNFKDTQKEKFDALVKSVMPVATWRVYDAGNRLMNAKKYQEALDKLIKVSLYGVQIEYMDVVLYNTGQCYKGLNDTKNALAAFRKLRESYPQSRFAGYAEYRMKELEQQPQN